jgi:hypothetical protein
VEYFTKLAPSSEEKSTSTVAEIGIENDTSPIGRKDILDVKTWTSPLSLNYVACFINKSVCGNA